MDKKETFIKAIQANEGLIYKVAAIYTDNADDRDDLVQEIIYQLWKSFDSFKQQSALSTWMYQVAMNVAIYHLKKINEKCRLFPSTMIFLNLRGPGSDDTDEKLRVLKRYIEDLNLLDKGIVMLYLEDKSHEEIALITGISKTNVGTKLSRIKEKLKQQIKQQQ